MSANLTKENINLLAIDTSSSVCAIGLQMGQHRYQQVTHSGRSHSRDILPAVQSLLQQADARLTDLHAIVFGQGPGSFTGLRIATGVVQGLGFGLQIPVIPVSTLACLAQGEYRRSAAQKILVVLAARKQEVFWGAYEIIAGMPKLMGSESVDDVADLPRLPMGEWFGVGDGWQFKDSIEKATAIKTKRIQLQVEPDPVDLLDIGIHKLKKGETVDAVNARPEYLREQVANLPSS